jgi:hypothetical protein
MGERPKHKKPRRNPAHIVFPKQGPVRRVIEEMPREKGELELRVARQFVNSVRHQGVYLNEPRPGPDPPDVVCNTPDGQEIGLELVEIVNEPLRQLQEMRSTYRDALWHALGDDLLHFDGCRVSLCDSAEPPLLPKVSSAAGQVCLRHLADFLRSVGKEVHTLQVGKTRNWWTTHPERKIWVAVERRLPPGEPVRLELHWEGGGPGYRTDVSRGLLTGAVRLKAKLYAKPTTAKFLLLAYSIDTLLDEDDPDVIEARQFLDTTKHPFDEVWYSLPMAHKDFGPHFKVWPV